MAGHQSSHALSPQLGTVLSSLSISLEAELNRYRRNRRVVGLAEEDLFAELEDPSFDLEAIERAVEASVAHTATIASPLTPPPVPPNKKLSAFSSMDPNTGPKIGKGTTGTGRGAEIAEISSALAVSPTTFSPETPASQTLASQTLAALQPSTQVSGLAVSGPSYLADAASEPSESSTLMQHEAASLSGNIAPTGYLASSEKLIESLAEVLPMPGPEEATVKPKRKTVSLLAGATLGLCGLIAGLGASYLMANPLVTQRLASSLQGADGEATIATKKAFDPPGPDLSANEFIDLEIDNLSSLKMPQTAIAPNVRTVGGTSEAGLTNPANADGLPPIEENQAAKTGLSTASPATNPAPTPMPTVMPTVASPPVAPAAIETQAVVIPTGLTYYVTTPFTTEQNLVTIRESVSEAFVRRFSNGERVQIAAFDNPQTAGAFVEELKAKSITAQIYGPTTE